MSSLDAQADIVAKTTVPAAESAHPYAFLSLAPATSSSYPVRKVSVTAEKPVSEAGELEPEIVPTLEKTRRSSSLSSNGSGLSGLGGKRRFLKLGPVHDGVHNAGEEGDWSEDVVVE